MFSCKHGGCICDHGFLSKSEISAAPLETHTHIFAHYRGQVFSSHKIGNILNIFKNGQTIYTHPKANYTHPPGSELGQDASKEEVSKKQDQTGRAISRYLM